MKTINSYKQWLFKKPLYLVIGLFIAWATCISPTANAAQPAYGPLPNVNDLTTSGWDGPSDFFADIFLGGDPNKLKVYGLFLRYDCDANTLGILFYDEALINADGTLNPAFDGSLASKDGYMTVRIPPVVLINGAPQTLLFPPPFKNPNLRLVGQEDAINIAPGNYKLIVEIEVKNLSTGINEPAATVSLDLTIVCAAPT